MPQDAMTSSTNRDSGPVLDEATFQKLLAAAYVLQEHRDQLPDAATPASSADSPESDSTTTLAEIVETQHQIHTKRLDLASAMNLVVERILKITGAQGAAIGVLEQDKIDYRAASGTMAAQLGKSLRPEATISSATVLHDAILRVPEASTDFRVNPEVARQLKVGSLISVPVFHDGKTAGTLELAFANSNAFHEHDVRTCQLMAGLVTEALTHAAEEEWRKGVAAERASMLQVLEKIKPQLARLTQDPKSALPLENVLPAGEVLPAAPCAHCGHELAAGEVFCASCGTSRSNAPRGDLQSKWATLWNLKKVSEQLKTAEPELAAAIPEPPQAAPPAPARELPDYILPEKSATVVPPAPPAALPESVLQENTETFAVATPTPEAIVTQPVEPLADAIVPSPEKPPQSRELLHSIAVPPPAVQGFLQKHKALLRKHPGDVALIAAAILFLITIIWAVSSDHPTTSADSGNSPGAATANANTPPKPKKKQAPPAPKLSFFEQFLVSLGLADAPPAPTYTGNPDVPVWVDVHTALYYCPGSELYGKTPQGRIASQKDAQADQFEPASRKVCD